MNLLLKAGLTAANDLFNNAGFRTYDVILSAILFPDVKKGLFISKPENSDQRQNGSGRKENHNKLTTDLY